MAAESLALAGSLKHQAILYVVGHLEEFSPQSLSLLPVAVRKEILLIIPVVDVQQLESTEFMKEIDLNEIWRSIYEMRVPKNMQTALLDLLKRQEIDRACLDLSWKEKLLLCCFDSATASKFYRQANKVMYLFEIIMFCVNKTDFTYFECLPNAFQSLFNLRSSKMTASNLSTLISRSINDELYSSLLSPMPSPSPQGQNQPNPSSQQPTNFVNFIDVMKFLQNFFHFRPRILLLHNVTILDITQNVLWPTAHISGITTASATTVLTDFLQDVQLVCMRSRGWNPAKNLSVLRTVFQVLVSNKKKMLSGIVLDLLNIGVPAQNQVLAAISSTLTGLLLIPHQAHVRAVRQTPYNCLTVFSVYLSLESADEMKHINAIIRSQLQLQVVKINCNNKAILFDPRPFEAEVYTSLFESVTMLVFTNPSIQQLELSQAVIPGSIIQNLLYHFLTSTSSSEQLLSLSCLGVLQSPLKSRVPVCKSESASDAGKHGPRSLKLHMCHFPPEMYEWLCGFPRIKLKTLELISTDVTDNLSALNAFSKLKNLEVAHFELSVVSVQELWGPLSDLLFSVAMSKVKLTANLNVRNVSKEHLPLLVNIVKNMSARVFSKLHVVLATSSVNDTDVFNSLLTNLFGLPYLNDLSLILVSPGLRKSQLNNMIRMWELVGKRNRLKSLSIVGDSTVLSSNLSADLKESLSSMADHYCHSDICGCLTNRTFR